MGKPVEIWLHEAYGGIETSMGKEAVAEARRLVHDLPQYAEDWPRHDPRLLALFRRLIKEGKPFAIEKLRGRRYRVTDYDGHESYSEPEDITWIDVPEDA